jgi:hypothetical protein
MVRFGRTDANQKSIVTALRKVPGVSVKVLSDVGGGFPDLIVGYAGVNFLVELKHGSKLTPDQVEFHMKWNGQKAVANNLDEVLKIIGVLK